MANIDIFKVPDPITVFSEGSESSEHTMTTGTPKELKHMK